MIRKVNIQNFRCLRNMNLTLEPLTVIVGPNSSGKTTVLEGLRADGPARVDPADFWQRDTSRNILMHWDYDTGRSALLEVERLNGQRAQFKIDSGGTSANYHSSQSFAFDIAALRRENMLAHASRLGASGENLTNVFASLTRKQQSLVAQELCRLVPMFSDVDLQPTVDGKQRLRFQDRWNSDFWLAPQEVSDGTVLLLAFIVLQYQEQSVDLITIEDPERALHPYLLDELIQMLRKMTTGEIGGKPVQVVLATHSAELLDYVRPEEVRFLTRSQKDGSVQVHQASTGTTNWRRVYEEYNQSLGSIWLSGGMGGVPGA